MRDRAERSRTDAEASPIARWKARRAATNAALAAADAQIPSQLDRWDNECLPAPADENDAESADHRAD